MVASSVGGLACELSQAVAVMELGRRLVRWKVRSRGRTVDVVGKGRR